jgi:hypothetical protein
MPYVCTPEDKAHVVKLVDTSDLGSDAARCGGSSPSMRTNPGQVSKWPALFYFLNQHHFLT